MLKQGLFTFDATVYIAMGAWIANKSTYAHGNVLSHAEGLRWVESLGTPGHLTELHGSQVRRV